jgi:hypothetical protein
MKLRNWTLGLGALGLGLVLTFGKSMPPLRAADPPPPADGQVGVEPQARGPVHEAFAEPGSSSPQATPVITKKPPEPIEELPPDQKPEGDNMQWITGYWAYDDDRADFIWISGLWRSIPPGRQWMPGHWAQVEGGWQWTPGFWGTTDQEETELLPPPPKTIDNGPSTPPPGVDSVYVPGVWVYQTRRFVWRPGFWYTATTQWVWVPAHYVWTPGGYIFVEGYWDYPLETRGLLFAPVVIERRYWTLPRWYYRPSFVVYQPALEGALFVRPGYGYYFGDYFEANYRRRGFVCWVDFRLTRYSYDPLYTYARWRHRGDRAWDRDLHSVYAGRLSGQVARPPRTFVQQTTVIKNITVNKTVSVTNLRNVTVLAPLARVDRRVVKLQRVSRERLALEQKSVKQMRAVARQRQLATARVVAKGPGPKTSTDVPRVAKMRLPKVTSVIKPKVAVKPPVPPVKSGAVRKPVTKPVKPVIKHRPGPVVKPQPKPAPRPVIKPRANPAPKPRAKPAPKVQPRPRVKPQPKPAPKPVIKPRANPAPKVQPKPVVKPRAQPQPRPQPRQVVKAPPKPRSAPPVRKPGRK